MNNFRKVGVACPDIMKGRAESQIAKEFKYGKITRQGFLGIRSKVYC